MPAQDLSAMALLHPVEREYVASLKRKDRSNVLRALPTKRPCAVAPLRVRVLQSHLPTVAKQKIFEDLTRDSSDKYLTWVNRALSLPLGVQHKGPPNAKEEEPTVMQRLLDAKEMMERSITGLVDAKTEVLHILYQTTENVAGGYSLGLEGPPGTGKTHFVRSALAPALGRPLVSIPLGGATDVSFLLGNMYTYEGSKEGRLAAALVECRCCDPIIFFDEVDKISTTDRGAEIASTLIHLIDPSSQKTLRDRYFHGIDIDFSRCTFVFSYNDPLAVNPVLLDRIKRVRVPPPTDVERVSIIATHMVPRIQARIRTSLDLSPSAVASIVARAAPGVGMRSSEKDIEHVLTCAHLKVLLGEEGEAGPLDSDGRVSEAFVKGTLSRTAEARSSAPPPGMYT